MSVRIEKLFIVLLLLLGLSCQESMEYHKFSGETMGTYYAVTFEGRNPQKVKTAVDDLLISFNNSLSTYIPTSLISKLNASAEGVYLPDGEIYFEPVLKKAELLKNQTNGKLNTAIMPLLRYWRDNSTKIDTTESQEISKLVSTSTFEIVNRDGSKFISKSDRRAELDFSSLAKGYGIDIVGDYLVSIGVENFLVDIGGEARAHGISSSKAPWRLAINKPVEGSSLTDMELVVALSGKSIATSGSYRQFYEKDGKKIAHIMDPMTGYSTTSDLLSASVIADDCMTADGVATALMVSSLEEAKSFLEEYNYLACLIYDGDGDEKLEKYYANGFEEIVLHSK
jgi:thiamine biosynthesis lipoprotein